MSSGTARVVLVLAVFATIGVALLGPIAAVTASNTGTQSVANEGHAVEFDEQIDLRGYDIDPGSETVYGYNDTSGSYEAAPESDYTLHEDGGQLELDSSSSLFDEGEEVRVDYDYQASDGVTALVIEFIPVGVALFLFVGVARGLEAV